MGQIKNFLKTLRIRYNGRPSQLKKTIKEAKKLHKQDGKRYRVFFFGDKYRAWNREQIKDQKRIGLLKHGLKVGEDFDKICFYDTQNPNGYVSDK